MNFKNVLKGLEAFTTAVVPGASGVDEAIRAVVSSKGVAEKEVASVQALVASIQMLESMGIAFADEPGFQAGLLQIQAGAVQVAAAVKAKHAVQ